MTPRQADPIVEAIHLALDDYSTTLPQWELHEQMSVLYHLREDSLWREGAAPSLVERLLQVQEEHGLSHGHMDLALFRVLSDYQLGWNWIPNGAPYSLLEH